MAGSGIIRRVWPTERERVREHLLRLDAQSRRLRFAGLVGLDRARPSAPRATG
jgi:hypothetical protein